jgi:hypothetical protein
VGIGLFRYGLTIDQAKEILAREKYCERSFELRPIPWILREQVPPSTGPYYGVYEKGVGGDPISILIAEGGVLAFGAHRFLVAGGSFQWYELPGNPQVLQRLQKAQRIEEAQFAEEYWAIEKRVRAFLREPHTEDELRLLVSTLLAERPASQWSLHEAKDPKERFRDSAILGEGVRCGFEQGLKWEKILSFELQEEIYARELNPLYSTLANIYVKGNQVTGVLFYEWNCDGATSWAYNKVDVSWSPHRTLYYWSFANQTR